MSPAESKPTFSDLTRLAQTGEDSYRAGLGEGGGFLYGGLTMSVAVSAAAATVPDTMVAKSLRTSFLRFGEWASMDLSVERTNSGRTFAGRRISVRQRDRAIAVADVTFHRPDGGADVQTISPPAVPGPESLDTVPGMLSEVHLMELKPVDPTHHGAGRIHPYWCRISADLGPGAAPNAAGMAFMSDYMVIQSPFEPGAGEAEGLSSFTLEHCLWFHRPFRSDDWLLFDASPVSRSDGRFLSRGTVFDRHGALVATFVQEGIIRPGAPRTRGEGGSGK